MITQIMENLWIGEQSDSEKEETLRNFDFIVNLNDRESKIETSLVEKYHIVYVIFPRPDKHSLMKAAGYLSGAIATGKRILVHCEAGIDRAPFVVALCLAMSSGRPPTMLELRARLADAYKTVKKTRPQVVEHYEWL
jgi:protein-tyrosine phosphatase